MHERIKTWGYYGLLFVISLTVFSTVFSGRVNAAPFTDYGAGTFGNGSTALRLCDFDDPALSGVLQANWRANTTAEDSNITWGSNDSWVVTYNNSSGNSRRVFVAYLKDKKFVAKNLGPENRIYMSGDTDDSSKERISRYAPTNPRITVSDLYGDSLPYNPSGCILEAYNIRFDPSWVGERIPTENKVPDTSPVAECSPLDLPCWFGEVFTGFTETMEGLAKAILSGIAYLFVPDYELMKITFEDLKYFFTQKLGFLVYPITFIIETYDMIAYQVDPEFFPAHGICYSASYLPTIPGLPGGGNKFFGQNIDPADWFCGIPSYFWSAIQWFARISVTLAIVYMFNKKLHHIIGGKEA